MPYAVDNRAIQASARDAREGREALRLELGLVAGRPVVLFAAKLVARKRPLDLLEAILRVAADPRARNPYLLFAGDGSERGLLEARAAADPDRIRFLGFRSQAELPALFDLADLFVLPSVSEPWGMVVNEAMNAGTGILTSDQVGCAADLVVPGENGAIFPAGNVSALAESLLYLLGDDRLLARMGRRSLELIAQVSFEADIAGLKTALGIPP
jgi:glycosyltransferase involved in cell wall biosynthesis